MSLRTATPVDVTFCRDLGFGIYNFRPDVVAGVPLEVVDANVAGGRRFNYDAFEIPQEFPGRQGLLGRNVLRGFGMAQVNLTARREFRVAEGMHLQVRAELFNALNRPAFSDPSGELLSSQFGYSTRMLGRSLGRGGSEWRAESAIPDRGSAQRAVSAAAGVLRGNGLPISPVRSQLAYRKERPIERDLVALRVNNHDAERQ